MGCARSHSRDFKSFPKLLVGLDEYIIQLILNQYNSNFVTYEKTPGHYSIKGISNAVYTVGDHEETLKIGYDDITKKTKLILTRFGVTVDTLRYNGKYFLVVF